MSASRGKLVVTLSAAAAGLVVLVAAATVGEHLWRLRLQRAEDAARAAFEKEMLRALEDLRLDVRVYSER